MNFTLDNKKNENDEYIIKCYKDNGSRHHIGDYFTTDWEDAKATFDLLTDNEKEHLFIVNVALDNKVIGKYLVKVKGFKDAELRACEKVKAIVPHGYTIMAFLVKFNQDGVSPL